MQLFRRRGTLSALVLAASLNVLSVLATLDSDAVSAYTIMSTQVPGAVETPESQRTSGTFVVEVFGRPVFSRQTAGYSASLETNVLGIAALIAGALGAAFGAMLGFITAKFHDLSERQFSILLVVSVLLGLATQLTAMGVHSISDGEPKTSYLWLGICGTLAGAAFLSWQLFPRAVGGTVAGTLCGYLAARVMIQFTSGPSGLAQGDVLPFAVIVGGPIVGAILGAILALGARPK